MKSPSEGLDRRPAGVIEQAAEVFKACEMQRKGGEQEIFVCCFWGNCGVIVVHLAVVDT